MLSASERHRLLVEWNATQTELPTRCLHELFEAQAACRPNTVALIDGEQRLSYGELNARANRLAHHLRALGVGPEVLVAIRLGRSVDLVIALLATLKAGGAYVPLDLDYPRERLAFMLADTAAPVLITHAGLCERLPAYPGALVTLDGDAATIAACSGDNPPNTSTPDNLAYVIYTSGSTGLPKGVMVTHASVARLFEATNELFKFDEQDVWMLFHSIGFDFSVWEMWGALPLIGGSLVIVPLSLVARSPDRASLGIG